MPSPLTATTLGSLEVTFKMPLLRASRTLISGVMFKSMVRGESPRCQSAIRASRLAISRFSTTSSEEELTLSLDFTSEDEGCSEEGTEDDELPPQEATVTKPRAESTANGKMSAFFMKFLLFGFLIESK